MLLNSKNGCKITFSWFWRKIDAHLREEVWYGLNSKQIDLFSSKLTRILDMCLFYYMLFFILMQWKNLRDRKHDKHHHIIWVLIVFSRPGWLFHPGHIILTIFITRRSLLVWLLVRLADKNFTGCCIRWRFNFSSVMFLFTTAGGAREAC